MSLPLINKILIFKGLTIYWADASIVNLVAHDVGLMKSVTRLVRDTRHRDVTEGIHIIPRYLGIQSAGPQ